MKKVVSALLIMLMLIQTVSFAATNQVYSEEDTKMLVDRLNALGIFEKFDEELFFDDNADVKRGEAAVVIGNMLGMKDSGSDSVAEGKFFDVPQYSDYANAVNYVTSLGIMSANGAGLFLPDDSMEIAHVLKALVVALGYNWKAEAYGGYPQGYIKVASELEITDVLTKGIHETATRVDFLNLVNASLDVPICRMKSISGDAIDFEIDEDVTLLSEYHDIYIDEDVVESNKSVSIISVPENTEEVVYIGGRKLNVNGVTSVYSYLGYRVKYYYRYDKKAETNYLVTVTPTDDNTVTRISKVDFAGFANGEITYYNEAGKEKDVKLSGSAVVLYNGEVTTNVAAAINSFEGTLTLIDNNDDNRAEIVIAKKYEYDKVTAIKADDNAIHTENQIISLNEYETVDIVYAETGETIDLSGVLEGGIIGYAKSSDESKLMIDYIGSNATVKVASISQDTFTTDQGVEYNSGLLSEKHKNLIKPNAMVTIVAIDGYYAVWASVASETVSIGYLINIATDTEFDETFLVGARIFDVTGSIKAYKPANKKKMILNGKSVNVSALADKLAAVKAEYQLGGDGVVSQLIGYKLDDDGNLSHIYTLNDEDENNPLYLKFAYLSEGKAQIYTSAAYGTGLFTGASYTYSGRIPSGVVHNFYKRQYMVPSTTTRFIVPMGEQLSRDDWYRVESGAFTKYEDKTLALETYTSDKNAIVPKAAVIYIESEETPSNVLKAGTLVLIDSTYQSLNNDDGVDFVIKGLTAGGSSVSYTTDSTEVSADYIEALLTGDTKLDSEGNPEEPGFTRGDIATVSLDAINRIIRIGKLYDRETGNIHPDMWPENSVYVSGDSSSERCALILHTYNKPDDGYGLEFFEEDLTLGVPEKDRMLLLNLHGQKQGKVNDAAKTFAFYDESEDKVYLGSSQGVIDYLHDKENYTRIFAVHANSQIMFVFYNK